ncbi:hypothetical protein COX95_03865 [bacterium CG_4_10_14_0_2_um_filter_33_32]|nr:MAG: hypothetical protein AUJ93_00460 [bacterium CG2_30_33_46]PIR67793.1 MAG: hypothetical protein COU50_01455 [bacterium CG10_big_fil_rev_8_21_14_0_10_33_18]PIU76820.1 MAG: hypothetical protein COS74_02085 [bacterium CG06_land_8_20_14_3_00_33_50]PIW81619.1 MAG: hypothetical protein COZ97_00855 [bacterium CG_4_8_14_3_um_filter_33_28]PIY85523.1 MAG: hypothetical protein COY76_01700 [bacterium CG_4_10_14_0_8_um_filter_33_57]PIZ85502.1 MAG: hypothetical protein COX95_03865 [bacterium CG_4_10_1
MGITKKLRFFSFSITKDENIKPKIIVVMNRYTLGFNAIKISSFFLLAKKKMSKIIGKSIKNKAVRTLINLATILVTGANW